MQYPKPENAPKVSLTVFTSKGLPECVELNVDDVLIMMQDVDSVTRRDNHYKDGTQQVDLGKDGRRTSVFVHEIIWEAF